MKVEGEMGQDEENRFQRLCVLLDEDLRLWKRFPHILMMDVTHGTNRFNHKLLEINGITHFSSVFPIAFAIGPKKQEGFFEWTLNKLDYWIESSGATTPLVLLTDYAEASRNAIRTIWSSAQLQLCTWHISKNILKAVHEKWQGATSSNDLLTPREMTNESAGIEQPTYNNSDCNAFLVAFRGLLFAPSIEEFNQRWVDMQFDFLEQEDLIQYLSRYYIPVRAQWARPWTKTVRNYGHTTTSPNEAQHSSTKTFIRSPNSSLFELIKALFKQRQTARNAIKERTHHEASRNRNSFRNTLYADVVDHLTW
jgi:hypothetical protein